MFKDPIALVANYEYATDVCKHEEFCMAYSLIGKNFIPPDVHGKVTGKAKYAEDFKVDGMLQGRLPMGPVPVGVG